MANPLIHTDQFIIGYIVGIITAACSVALICELLSRWYEHHITSKKEDKDEEG